MISFEKYNQRLFSVAAEYDLVRKTIKDLQENPTAKESFAIGVFNDIKKSIIDNCKIFGENPNHTWISDNKKVKDWINSYKDSALPKSLEESLNRLNQNDVIMKITLFEVILKDIHREILIHNQHLLSADRKVPLGKLIHEGKDKIVEEEIEREISILDRKSIRAKATYFKDRLNVDWTFEGHIFPIVEYVFDLRNKILHKEPDIKVTKDDCFHATTVSMTIPLVVIAQCSVLYPEGFEYMNNSSLKEHYKKKLKDKTQSG